MSFVSLCMPFCYSHCLQVLLRFLPGKLITMLGLTQQPCVNQSYIGQTIEINLFKMQLLAKRSGSMYVSKIISLTYLTLLLLLCAWMKALQQLTPFTSRYGQRLGLDSPKWHNEPWQPSKLPTLQNFQIEDTHKQKIIKNCNTKENATSHWPLDLYATCDAFQFFCLSSETFHHLCLYRCIRLYHWFLNS